MTSLLALLKPHKCTPLPRIISEEGPIAYGGKRWKGMIPAAAGLIGAPGWAAVAEAQILSLHIQDWTPGRTSAPTSAIGLVVAAV